MNILFAPFAAKMPNKGGSPKDYPYALALAKRLEEKHDVIQVGSNQDMQICENIERNRTFVELQEMISECDTAVCVDSYLQHLMWYCKKRAIVLWGQSDYRIFGHPIHRNMFVSHDCFRPGVQQFQSWMECTPNPKAFVPPDLVMRALKEEFPTE
jgi:ADP-heptose:LPS heptosyltransferase